LSIEYMMQWVRVARVRGRRRRRIDGKRDVRMI